jgi:AcrR family transcriptional regulator
MNIMSGENTQKSAPRRKYEKRRRAEQERETRLRITEAAVALHGTVGPARTTISELAERAGVQRGTVYRHFPDEADLFEACSSHWSAAHPPPDPGPLGAIDDPVERLRTALAGLYAYYRENEGMLANIYRDLPSLPALAAATERRQAGMAGLERLLGEGWSSSGDTALRRAAISLALDFRTWQALVRERGLTDESAAALMVRAAAG